jgi:hypothetical protein
MENNQSIIVRDQIYDSEEGSVDAGLALIPTTLFFIILLQIVLAGSWQVMERAKLHDLVIRDSISGAIPKRYSEHESINPPNLEIESKKLETKYGVVRSYFSQQKIPVFGTLLTHLGMGDFKLKLSAISIE